MRYLFLIWLYFITFHTYFLLFLKFRPPFSHGGQLATNGQFGYFRGSYFGTLDRRFLLHHHQLFFFHHWPLFSPCFFCCHHLFLRAFLGLPFATSPSLSSCCSVASTLSWLVVPGDFALHFQELWLAPMRPLDRLSGDRPTPQKPKKYGPSFVTLEAQPPWRKDNARRSRRGTSGKQQKRKAPKTHHWQRSFLFLYFNMERMLNQTSQKTALRWRPSWRPSLRQLQLGVQTRQRCKLEGADTCWRLHQDL